MRTLWGVTPILTLPLLARCDRLLGFASDSLVYTTYYTTSRFDLSLKRVADWVIREIPSRYANFCRLVFAWALLRYDVFHFFCDRGLLAPSVRIGINEREMLWLRAAGKVLYAYAYGADVRTRRATLEVGEPNLCAGCPEPGKFCQCDDHAGVRNMSAISQHAAALVSMGDMLAYMPGARNLHYWPIDVQTIRATPLSRRVDEPLRVAHAPNHPQFKGTAFLVEAIDRLRAEGVPIELVRVQGVPNEEVLALFRSAHVVADQFVAGFHGYTALEAMALGRPVLCYLRNPDMMIDPASCPIVQADPRSLYDTLKALALGRVDLEHLGRRSREYVERHYRLEAVAARLGRLYLDQAGLPAPLRDRLAQRVRALEATGV